MKHVPRSDSEFLSYPLISKLCGNLRGMVIHFQGVLQIRTWEALLAHILVSYHVVVVVDAALQSILWDLNFLLDNGFLQVQVDGIHTTMMSQPGMNCDYHHPAVSGPPIAHGHPTMAFQSGAVNTLPRQDPVPIPIPSTPLQNPGTEISQLEERLGEALNKRFESMTETLKASMSTSMENASTPATTASAKAPSAVLPPEPEPPVPSALDGTTATTPASVPLDAVPSDRPSMLISKAKPPARPEEEQRPSRSTRISSRRRSTPRRSRGRNISPSYNSHRRSLHRRRAHSDRHHRGDHGSTSPRSRPHDRPLPRTTDQDASTNQTHSLGKDRSHPIYHRSNAMRTRTTTSGHSGYTQIHSDIHQTVYSRSARESHGRDSRHQPDRTTSSITLRSRSRSWIEDKAFTFIPGPNLNLHQL